MRKYIATCMPPKAIAQILRWTDPADGEQLASTGGSCRAGPTRTTPAHGCLTARRRGTNVPTALECCTGLARMDWCGDPPGLSGAPPRRAVAAQGGAA